MRIICHPSNVEAVRAATRVDPNRFSGPLSPLDWIEIIADPSCPRNTPNGKYRLPDGSEVTADEFTLSTRFVTYDKSDIPWLLLAGIIKECVEMHFYIMNDLAFNFRMDPMPIMRSPFLMANYTV